MTLRSWAGGSYLLISVDWDPESELDLSGASAVFRIIFSPASLVCSERRLQAVAPRAKKTHILETTYLNPFVFSICM